MSESKPICHNTTCSHHAPKGCTLFAGEAWRRCRMAQSQPIPIPKKKKEKK